ncbi:MAG: SEC-C metal-binding domain-containing protein, partial [Planctomycetia bacterium]|nr:SEC-C metal-binding domain-containing protein [Planctomycetia bacterium]
ARNMLMRLGQVEPGHPLSDWAIISRRIEGAQKKVEERNFEIRKHLLEYDEVMDTQRKRVYGYRQNILDGIDTRHLVREMISGEVRRHVGTFLDPDYGVETFAAWTSKRLSCTLKPKDLRGMDYPMAEVHAKDLAEREAERQIFDLIDENLPEDSDPSEWLWESLAHAVNTRWGLSLSDRDLKKIEREDLPPELIERALEAIRKVDLSEGARLLEPDFPLETTCAWVKQKFALTLDPAELRGREPAAIEAIVLEKAYQAYDDREVRIPLLAAVSHFTLKDSHGNRFVDPAKITEWAWTRFGASLGEGESGKDEPEKLEARCLDESRRVFSEGLTKYAELAELTEALTQWTSERVSATSGALKRTRTSCEPFGRLMEWCGTNGLKLPEEWSGENEAKLGMRSADQIGRIVRQSLDDRYRPEMHRIERILLLELLDQAWKEHLRTMDHLRSAVGLRGYAQTDPKVEFKREGMKIFEEMWGNIEQRVTDYIYRMEQLDESFIGSTWAKGQIQQKAAPTSSLTDTGMAQQQQEAIDGSRSDTKPEPIRNYDKRVGRNDPCPCGSGKKFKKCHGRNLQ